MPTAKVAAPEAGGGHAVLVKGVQALAGRQAKLFRWVAQSVGGLQEHNFPALAESLAALGLPVAAAGSEACALIKCETAEKAARVVQLLHGCTAVPGCGDVPHRLGAVTGKAVHQARGLPTHSTAGCAPHTA